MRTAGRLFLKHGLEELTIRGIAREAGVDPALVLYYFRSNEELSLEALGATLRPLVDGTFRSEPLRRGAGAMAVLQFLRFWDNHSQGAAFAGLVYTVASRGRVGDAVREFMTAQIEAQFAGQIPREELKERVGLFMAQIIGLGVVRYLFRTDPIASAIPESLADSIGPSLDRCLLGRS